MAKPANKRQNNANQNDHRSSHGGGSTFLGIMIGLVLGLFIALGLAWYINKLPNPFREKPPATQQSAEPPKTKVPMTAEPAREREAAPAPKVAETNPVAAETPAKGEDAPAVEKPEAEKKSTPVAKETFYIQAGSFQNASEAESLKARLALLGLEASLQVRILPDRGTWHRVRVGPYSDVEELNRIRDVLKQNNIDSALVKVRETDK